MTKRPDQAPDPTEAVDSDARCHGVLLSTDAVAVGNIVESPAPGFQMPDGPNRTFERFLTTPSRHFSIASLQIRLL